MKKQVRKKLLDKMRRSKPTVRLVLPTNKRHKSKKDYRRKNKVRTHEVEGD